MYTRSLAHFIICILFETCASQIISQISQTQIKDVGDTVDLHCSVQHAKNNRLVWSRVNRQRNNERLYISERSFLLSDDSRFSVSYDIDPSDSGRSASTLQIRDINGDDAGFYQCLLMMSLVHHVSAEVELLVRQPPVIFDNSTSRLVVSEGEDVQLECYASGYPIPKISWLLEDNYIQPAGASTYGSNILPIKQVRKEDRGTYNCIAENGVGGRAFRNICVEVESPVIPEPREEIQQRVPSSMEELAQNVGVEMAISNEVTSGIERIQNKMKTYEREEDEIWAKHLEQLKMKREKHHEEINEILENLRRNMEQKLEQFIRNTTKIFSDKEILSEVVFEFLHE